MQEVLHRITFLCLNYIYSMIQKKHRYIKSIIISLISFLILIIASTYYLLLTWSIDCNFTDKIVIPRGVSLNKTISILKANSCFEEGTPLKILMIITNNDRNIRPGIYDLKEIDNIGKLMNKLTSDSKNMTDVRILEGWTMHQTASELMNIIKIDSTKFINLCHDQIFISELDINASSIEGYLYPDTYSFSTNRIGFNIDEKEVIKRLVNQFRNKFEKYIISKKYNGDLSIHNIITLASIIQGECVFIDEMDTVSSVYNNRLRKHWLLQADPTIQYLKPGKNKRLYNKDYKRYDSPYNTYIYKGLPPGPISSPGIDAIIAASFPAETKYMFFVARGDNRHHFSSTEEEHNKAKTKYLKKIW